MNESILIVEDEPEFAALLERWISQAGYRPSIARTGHEALRMFYEQHPDLLVLDASLPGLDGWQVIERVREFSRVPIGISSPTWTSIVSVCATWRSTSHRRSSGS